MDPEREDRWRVWMAAAQAGDRAAYEQLLLDVLPTVRGFVRFRLSDRDAVEDVVQNVLLSLHRARHTYRSERPFLPWLRAIARNAVVDHLRERARRGAREAPLPDFEPAAELEEPALLRDELSAPLAAALADLPAAQRQAVELLHVEGLSVVAASSNNGITPGALKVRAHRGYRALRVRLAGEKP
jgi:RNA polymerase sigma-70 factor (ECF subfamily)